MILPPQSGTAPDSIMSVMSMYRYMLGPSTAPDDINPVGGLGRPPLAHTHSNLPLPNLNMQGSFPSSQSVHPLFNTSPSPHSPSAASARTQPGPNDPGQPATASEGIPPYSHQGPPPPPPPPASLTPVTSTNGNPPPSGGLVVPTPTRQRTIKSYHCRMCDQIFDNKSDLLVHSQTVHKTDPKPYRCPTCQKCFANSSYLSQHARIHAGIKPYKCQICERRFTQLCHLQQHIRTHTGEKPYKCQHPTCGKAFSQLSNLQSHSRSHMTDKPYRCNSCYKCFTDEQGLRDHIPKHSETKHLKTFICRICGKSYTQETYLARHMTKHQGVDPAANMLNLTSLRHQQTQPIQQQQPQSAGTGNQLQQTSTASGMSPLPSPNSVTGSMSATGGGQQQPHHQQGNGTHQQHHRTVNSTGQDLPDIKPFLENNGSDFNLDPNKPSAFMPLPHQFSSPNMMNTSVPSNFPFPSPRLPSTTLNSGLSRLSPPANSAYFPLSERVMPNLSPESMIANSLLRLQQIRDFSHSTHPVFPKSEPGSPHHKEFAHKEYSHKDYT